MFLLHSRCVCGAMATNAPSLAHIASEKLPDRFVGVEIISGRAEQRGGGAAGPSVAAAFDRIEDHSGAALAFAEVAFDHLVIVLDFGQLGFLGRFAAAIGAAADLHIGVDGGKAEKDRPAFVAA